MFSINSKTMTLKENKGVCFLKYNELEKIDFINHAFSTRIGGVSENEFTSMNLSFGRGDPDENVTENYKIFCDAAGFDYESLVASAADLLGEICKVRVVHVFRGSSLGQSWPAVLQMYKKEGVRAN